MIRFSLVLAACALAWGCSEEYNSKPVYGSTGLPKNCRAYIQASLNGYHSKSYTAEETLAGIDRNCGLYGTAWKEK